MDDPVPHFISGRIEAANEPRQLGDLSATGMLELPHELDEDTETVGEA